MRVQFPTLKVCQYCDREIKDGAWVSSKFVTYAFLCSQSCKERYENAGQQPEFRWDVT
jgi:hypothetical protein